MSLGLPDRIERKISPEPNTGCWLWINKPNRKTGYARIYWEGTRRDAHGVVYRLLRGVVPAGLQLDHLCRVRSCVNPEHLEPVTGRINNMRGEGAAALNARKTHCKRGHELTIENTYDRPDKRRQCVTCNRAHGYMNYRGMKL